MELTDVKTSYARWSHFYDQTFGAVTQVGRRRAAGFVNARGGDVLEVGVGTGLALPMYRGVSVTGIDYSEEMLDKARGRVADLGLTAVRSLRQMDARALDFADASFDTVTSMHVLSVVPDPEKVVSEMARVCRPGGRVVIVVHFARDTGLLAAVERFAARFPNTLGWHSDFERDRVLGDPRLEVESETRFPPLGIMTFMALRRL